MGKDVRLLGTYVPFFFSDDLFGMNRAAAEVKEDANRPETYRGMSPRAAHLLLFLIQQMRNLSCLSLVSSFLAIQFVSDAADVENPAFQPLSVSEVSCLLEVRRAQLEEVRSFKGHQSLILSKRTVPLWIP